MGLFKFRTKTQPWWWT